MIIDSFQTLSDAQALLATAGSTNVVDLTKVRGIGGGEPLELLVSTDVAPDSADGNETYTFQLETDSDPLFSAPVLLGGAIPILRTDPAGAHYPLTFTPDPSYKRYLRAKYTLGGTTPNLTVTAVITPMSMASSPALPAIFAAAQQINS
jgi:hypothetical protein